MEGKSFDFLLKMEKFVKTIDFLITNVLSYKYNIEEDERGGESE